MNYNFKRIAVFATILIAFIVSAVLLVNYFLQATLVINTPENTSAVVVRLHDDREEVIWSTNETDTHRVRVSKGEYTIGFNRDNQYTQYLSLMDFRDEKSYIPEFRAFQTTLPADSVSSKAFSTTEEGDLVYFRTNNSIVNLPDELQPLQNSILANEVVFGDPDTVYRYIAIDNFGNGYFVSSDSVRLAFEVFENEFNDTNDVVLAADYDSTRNYYCLLLSNGQVATFNGDSLKSNVVGVFKESTSISCNDGSIVVYKPSRPVDDEEKSREESFIITIDNEGTINRIDSEQPITRVVLQDSNIYYLEGKDLRSRTIGLEREEQIGFIASPDTSFIFVDENADENTLYVFKNGGLWQLDPEEKAEYRISSSALFESVIDAKKTKESFAFSVLFGPNSGTYITSSNAELISAWDTVRTSFPLTTSEYIIEPTVSGDNIIFMTTILSPIPSSGDTTIFDEAKISATNQIQLLEIDQSLYSIVFD